jgi:hypothetical protein
MSVTAPSDAIRREGLLFVSELAAIQPAQATRTHSKILGVWWRLMASDGAMTGEA